MQQTKAPWYECSLSRSLEPLGQMRMRQIRAGESGQCRRGPWNASVIIVYAGVTSEREEVECLW